VHEIQVSEILLEQLSESNKTTAQILIVQYFASACIISLVQELLTFWYKINHKKIKGKEYIHVTSMHKAKHNFIDMNNMFDLLDRRAKVCSPKGAPHIKISQGKVEFSTSC
jgi:LytS/YehU family sensor histidine kinase